LVDLARPLCVPSAQADVRAVLGGGVL
jgi:hypothetical protein